VLEAIQRDPRRLSAYNLWMWAYTDIKRRPYSLDRSRLKTALANLAKSDDSKTVWGQVLLGLGTLTLDEKATDQAIAYFEEAIQLDPAFGALYQELAQAYETDLNGRRALESWYQYLYTNGRTADIKEVQKHIDALENVRIEQPADGEQLSGPVKIRGVASGKEFRSYQVQVRPEASSGAWSTVGQGSSKVKGGSLATWNTTGLTPGKYRLRLVVVNSKGKEFPYDEITVQIGASP
jgi:tetratricopeptide (TPR) repeat protein